jgi:hypothetical protein
MKAIIDYTEKTLSIEVDGQEFNFDLNNGDTGDFWNSFEVNGITRDINFAQESPEQKPSVAIYGVKDGQIDMDDEQSLEVEIEGDPYSYFEAYTKCDGCEKCLDNDRDFFAYGKDDKIYCESCESSAWDYSNTVVVVQDGEITKYRWCSEFGYRNTEDWEEADLDSVTGFEYVRTDGWRGYWNAQIGEDYTVVANGWSTGRWEDVAYKHDFNDFVEKIGSGDLECPFELVFAYGLTSNVFSVSSDVVIKESDLETFTEWIAQEAGLSVEDLKNALS